MPTSEPTPTPGHSPAPSGDPTLARRAGGRSGDPTLARRARGRSGDPTLARRARISRLTAIGQRVGYLLFGVAIVAFVAGAVAGFDALVVTTVVACLAAGSVVLAPAIVFGYAVKAAEREDREVGRR